MRERRPPSRLLPPATTPPPFHSSVPAALAPEVPPETRRTRLTRSPRWAPPIQVHHRAADPRPPAQSPKPFRREAARYRTDLRVTDAQLSESERLQRRVPSSIERDASPA
jgi:hypothetical protein